MPSNYSLGQHFEAFVQGQLDGGRYNNASEVLCDALRLMEDRERHMAVLDAAVARGVGQVKAGEVREAAEVLDRLTAKYSKMVKSNDSL